MLIIKIKGLSRCLQGEHLFQDTDGTTLHELPGASGWATAPGPHFQRPPTRPFPAPFRLWEKEGCQEGELSRPLRWAPQNACPPCPEEEGDKCILIQVMTGVMGAWSKANSH